MKKILGLDLGSASIGWALVNEAENENEKSSIVKLGARIINYDNFVSTETGKEIKGDPADYFRGGKGVSPCAGRTQKRTARRNLQRYKLRRENLIEILKEHGFITDDAILSENGNRTTFETYRLRAKAATKEISLEEFARVLLMINKKRGYKSSRKAKSTEEGALIDGKDIAIIIDSQNLSVGQYSLQILQSGKKDNNQYYPSDLQKEFDRIWTKQQEFYPSILTNELREELRDKKRDAVWAICAKHFVWKEIHTEWNNEEGKNEQIEKEHKLEGIYNKRKRDEAKIENLQWRSNGLTEKLSLEQLVIILQEINSQINSASGYLGAISDRSKELYFNKQTVGQYQMAVLDKNPNASLRNMVFYRQDYLDEFNTIWETQKQFHPELTDELKSLIRDGNGKIGGMFFQRRLKSQKGLINFCEFESHQIEVEINGKKKIKTVGCRVIPRSSPLFQEFKIWQTLNNVEVSVSGKKVKRKKKNTDVGNLFVETKDILELEGKRVLYQEEKELLAKELFVGGKLNKEGKLPKQAILKLLFENWQELDLNFPHIDSNKTSVALFKAYNNIIELSGHEPIDFSKTPDEVIAYVKEIFSTFNWNTDILYFNSNEELDKQLYYRLWHLLYSFEGDNSNTGNEKLVNKLVSDYGFDKDSAKILGNITFLDDYGSLSAKAIHKILPYLKEGNKYDIACEYAGYRHSKSSLTKEEIKDKILKEHLDILPKNSLRNPVVEKILNQMVNVINTIIDVYGRPDEIRVELARELKKNAKERAELTDAINKTTREHDEYKKILSQSPFNLSHSSRTDIVRYKLWQELRINGYKTLYSNTYIPPAELFSGTFDIEHIIPQARLFDDSLSNKTLELRDVNLKKGNRTAYDFVKEEYSEEEVQHYLARVENMYKPSRQVTDDDEQKSSTPISKAKYNKLKMTEADIPDGFIERDLRNTQFIAKKALTMLSEICRRVVATTGSITDELREDWGLVDIMKELNWDKHTALGLTEVIENTRIDDQGREKINRIYRIKDWTKRNDHRHHAMDALTVAFTKDVFIQYFNNKNASFRPNSNEYAIKNKYFDNNKAIPPMPLNDFRSEAKKHLENTLISIKAKNKVVTQNINATKKLGGVNRKIQQTPRGQLHLETVFGSQKQYVVKEEKVITTFDEAKILTVSNPKYREALLKRLQENGNDPKKAFGGTNALTKKPIWLNEFHTKQLPEKVKTVVYETVYTIRKDISPDLKLEKVIDAGVKRILEKRLKEYGNDAKKAFSNLGENPIWLNKEKGISIKRVTVTGISNAESLHDKRDKNGKFVLDKDGKKQPVDFVNTGNNHHVAIYRRPVLDMKGQIVRDENGEIQYELEENVVSFYEAVARKNAGLPIIDKEYNQSEGWEFLFSMKQNEYFVFPRTEKREKVSEETGEVSEEEVVVFNPKDYSEEWFKNPDNYAVISPNLFRVQKFSYKNYVFRHHLETSITNTSTALKGIIWTDFRSSKGLDQIIKVRVNHIGQIISVGEY